jgi:hypothetical protein
MVSKKRDRRLLRVEFVSIHQWLFSAECHLQIHLCTAKYLTLKRGESNIPNLFVKLEVGRSDEPPSNHRGAIARPSLTAAAGHHYHRSLTAHSKMAYHF